ncbi:MAG: hypothetical protein KAH00_00645, partial [Cocleimonas sp.]|nr:hypothetical protein [Cocleimonas sp.]
MKLAKIIVTTLLISTSQIAIAEDPFSQMMNSAKDMMQSGSNAAKDVMQTGANTASDVMKSAI